MICMYQKDYFKNIFITKLFINNINLLKLNKIYVGTANTIIRGISSIVKANGGKVYGFPWFMDLSFIY